MSGFFKKLFNRIVGKTEEAPPPEPVVAQIEAPEPAVAEIVPELPVPEPEAKAKPEPKPVERIEVEAKKPAPEKPEPKKPEPKLKAAPEPKKVEVKEPEPKKPEPKKVEVKKPEPKKLETKKAELKKVEVKKVEVKKPESKKVEVKKPEPKKLESKKAEPKTAPVPHLPLVGRSKIEGEAKQSSGGGLAVSTERPPPLTPRHKGEGDSLIKSKPASTVPVVEPIIPTPPPVVEIIPEPVAPASVPVAEERKGWLSRLTKGLSKSSKSITSSITSIFTKRKLDASTLEELEDVLIQADLGVAVSERIIKAVSAGRYDKEIEPEEVKRILAEEVAKVLKPVEVPFNFGSEKPFVILVVGVNGAGKTTTIGKLGAIATGEGFKVMFAACDTFRAAAIEQLTIWGERVGAKTLSRPTGSDSSGLAYDAMQTAREDGTDILFIDTAGRLQNKAYLMDELDKIVRVVKKQDETAPHAVLLILDATTGQNAISQAEIFTKVAGVTGLIMTKLDGTARGGILVAIAEKFALPIHAIGVGETIDDLQPFDADAFARAISGLSET
ncbi:MAG TPA: signal recognition particle-docking protein FtsY [Aestuariivirga sp.]|nr:signal recognition particle-docking protein FtsY [Aestuariivirga sp.]